MPVATVLLCVRDGSTTLDQQLRALSEQDFQGEWELVLVDNGSIDDTRAIATRSQPRFRCMRIVEESHIGLNRARNRGVREACAPLVVCCDADDEVSPRWLRTMVDALAQFDLVGGALDPGPLNGPNSPRAGCPQQTELPSVFGRRYSMGASLSFRRSVFDAIGGFDESFMSGSDEVDFCLRAQYAGFSIGFAQSAVVAYRVKDTARGVMRQRFAYGRGHQRLVEKHARLGHIRSCPIQRWKVVAVNAARLVEHVPDALNRESRLQYFAAVAYFGGRVTELAREARRSMARGTSWDRAD